MADLPKELLESSMFFVTPRSRREAIGHEVATALGPGWVGDACQGTKELSAVRHEGLNATFIVVPGGSFRMGFRPDDLAALAKRVDLESEDARTILVYLEQRSRPVREVRVAPFLLARDPLDVKQVAILDPTRESDEFTFDEARSLIEGNELRLPSEAECEWAARKGDAVNFAASIEERYDSSAYFPVMDLENGFGVRQLACPSWMADGWHENYAGAPSDSQAWVADAVPGRGVMRGAIETGIERPVGVMLCLAAYRQSEVADYVTARLARSLG